MCLPVVDDDAYYDAQKKGGSNCCEGKELKKKKPNS